MHKAMPVSMEFMPAAYRQVHEKKGRPTHSPPQSKTKHYETRHYSEKWRLDMAQEQELGLMPNDWSVSSKMDDARPNGQSMFDARFVRSPMGRARGGHSMVQDARGIEAVKGQLKKAENMDSAYFAADMADETEAAEKSAMANKFGNNTNLSSFDDASLALAQMSKLQKRQMDKDGDGNLSADELRANGFDTDMRVDL